jgi:hypothetical protein
MLFFDPDPEHEPDFSDHEKLVYASTLANLPPTLSSFDVIGGLLKLERNRGARFSPDDGISKGAVCFTRSLPLTS